MPHCGLHRRKYHVQPQIHQVHTRQRDNQVPPKNHALIQNMIENIQERQLVPRIVTSKNYATGGSAHFDFSPSDRDTKEYGGHGPVHSIRRRLSQLSENFFSRDSSFFRSSRLTSR